MTLPGVCMHTGTSTLKFQIYRRDLAEYKIVLVRIRLVLPVIISLNMLLDNSHNLALKCDSCYYTGIEFKKMWPLGTHPG